MPWIVFLSAVFMDQSSKALIQNTLQLRESVHVVGSVIKLTYIHNPRGAFGLPLGGNLVFIVFSVLAIFFIVYYLWKIPKERLWSKGALSLILGGALGNLIDRLRFGEVIDFIDIGIGKTRWPVFNVADIGVTVGVAFLFYAIFLKKES